MQFSIHNISSKKIMNYFCRSTITQYGCDCTIGIAERDEVNTWPEAAFASTLIERLSPPMLLTSPLSLSQVESTTSSERFPSSDEKMPSNFPSTPWLDPPPCVSLRITSFHSLRVQAAASLSVNEAS